MMEGTFEPPNINISMANTLNSNNNNNNNNNNSSSSSSSSNNNSNTQQHAVPIVTKARTLKEVVPKVGLVYSEKNDMTEILCKPKIMPIKSISLEKLERL